MAGSLPERSRRPHRAEPAQRFPPHASGRGAQSASGGIPRGGSALHGMAGNRPGRNVGIGIAEATAARAVPPCARKRRDRKPRRLARKRRRARRRLESAGRRWKCLARKQGSLARKPDCLAFHPAGLAPRPSRTPIATLFTPIASRKALRASTRALRPARYASRAGRICPARKPPASRHGTFCFARKPEPLARKPETLARKLDTLARAPGRRSRPGLVEDVSRQARSIRSPDCAPLASTKPSTCTSARIPSQPRRRARVTRGYARLDRCRKRWLITRYSTARWSTARSSTASCSTSG